MRYTGERWGQAQLLAYRDKIDEALQSIAHNPQLGHHRSDLPTTLRAYVVGSHLIVYQGDENGIGVARILHQRMSLGRHV